MMHQGRGLSNTPRGAAEPPFIVTVSAQIQSRLILASSARLTPLRNHSPSTYKLSSVLIVLNADARTVTNTMKKHLFALMLVSPITFAEIDQICPIYVKTYGWDMVAKKIKRNGCSRNDILQIFYGMDKPIKEMMLIGSNRWCRFDRNTDIVGISLSCVLNSTKQRIRLDSVKRRNMPTRS